MSRYESAMKSLLRGGDYTLAQLVRISEKAWQTLKFEHLEAYEELLSELEELAFS